MRTYEIDNRWSPGASGAAIPEIAATHYAARWIDKGAVADIVPDRQGFAYDDPDERARLAEALKMSNIHLDVRDLPRDETVVQHLGEGHSIAMRRSGGYIYVDAWREG